MRAAPLVLLAALSWCTRTTGPSPGAPEPEPATPAVQVVAPEARGEAIDAIIPLYRDGSTSLASLRGQVIVVEVFAADEQDWTTAHRRWRKLVADHLDDLTVVTVAVAGDDPRAVEPWDIDPPPYVVAWDPQGALALRLGVDSLPTVLVLDREGRLVARGADREALADVAVGLLDSEP